MALKRIVSFGFEQSELPPQAANGRVVIDLRADFKNPYHDRRLRVLRGTDRAVQENVLLTPGFDAKYARIKAAATAPGVEEVFIGCTSGHHRSVFLVERLGRELGVTVEHRDIHKSVIV